MKQKVDDLFIPADERLERERHHQDVKWHPRKQCKYCGDRMFWNEGWKKWVCRSWIYMEGGCPWW